MKDDDDRAYSVHVDAGLAGEPADDFDARWDFTPAPLVSVAEYAALELIPLEAPAIEELEPVDAEFVQEALDRITAEARRASFRRGVAIGAVSTLAACAAVSELAVWLAERSV